MRVKMSNVFSGIVHNYKNDIMVSLMVSIYPSIICIYCPIIRISRVINLFNS